MGGESCEVCSTCIASEAFVSIPHCLYVKFNPFCDDIGLLQKHIRIPSTLNLLHTGTHGLRRTMSIN
jgi:hypothetical protein